MMSSNHFCLQNLKKFNSLIGVEIKRSFWQFARESTQGIRTSVLEEERKKKTIVRALLCTLLHEGLFYLDERFVQTEPTAELWMQSASSQAVEPERRAREHKERKQASTPRNKVPFIVRTHPTHQVE